MRTEKFYPGLEAYKVDRKDGGMPVQTRNEVRREESLHLNPIIIRMAYEEYAAQGHGNQSLERLNERAGFGLGEIVMLLADALLRRGWVDA